MNHHNYTTFIYKGIFSNELQIHVQQAKILKHSNVFDLTNLNIIKIKKNL